MDDSVYVHHPRSDQMRHSLSRDSSMPEDRRSIPSPSSSAYTHDIPTSYASVPSFSNYPVPYDNSLPTPVSVAGSPSMNERTSKIMHSYSQHRAGSQQPTPPNTSRPWSNYQMNASATDLLEMPGLEASHSPDHSQLVSEPQFHQWGHYTVSSTEAPEELPPHMTHPSMFSVAPNELVRPGLSMHPSTSMPLPAPSSQIPILHSPDPRDLAPSVTPIDNMHHQYHNMMHHQPQVILNYEPLGNRRKVSKTRNGRSGRPPKRQRGGSRALSKNGGSDYMDPQLASGDGAPNSKVPGRHITLRPDAPEKDRYILELRCQMDNDKGKGIWEEITKKYEERFGKRRQESLQMNLTRAVLKYAEWPEEEDEALRRAVDELDRRRYSDIAKLMKEKYGGCQAWEWKDGHILKRLMELGIEEFDPEDITKKPRRKTRKIMNKRSSSKQSWVAPNMPLYSEDGRIISSEHENYILENYCKPDPDSPDPNAMQGVMEHPNPLPSRGSIDRDPGESRSERVAKQACEQLLSKGGNHAYGVLPVIDGHPQA